MALLPQPQPLALAALASSTPWLRAVADRCRRTAGESNGSPGWAARPPKADGWVGWSYAIGSGVLFSFILQVVTGIALASAYIPSTDTD